MSAMDLLVLGMIAIPAIGLTTGGVLLILKRTRFSATGSVIALVLGILSISFGAALVLALIFVAINLGSVVVGDAYESVTSTSYTSSATLGEKLFSEVMGRWDQDYGAELSQDINMSETIKGITVTVDRAYFDSNRIGIEYTVTGLPRSLPEGARVFEPQVVLMDAGDPGVRFRMAGGSGVRADSQIEGMEVSPDTVKEVVGFDVTGAEADTSGMRLLFVVSVDESVQDGNVLMRGGYTDAEQSVGHFP